MEPAARTLGLGSPLIQMSAQYRSPQLAKRPKPKTECLQWHPTEPILAAGFKDDAASSEAQVVLIDTRIASPPNTLGKSSAGHTALRCAEHGKGVNAIHWLPSASGGVADSFVTVGVDKRLVLWQNVFGASSSSAPSGHRCEILHSMHTSDALSVVQMSHTGTLVTIGRDGRLFGYDLASRRICFSMMHLAEKNSNDRELNCVRTSEVFPHLLLYSRNHTISNGTTARSPAGGSSSSWNGSGGSSNWNGSGGSNWNGSGRSSSSTPPPTQKQKRRQQQWLDVVDVRMPMEKPVLQMAWQKQDESKALSSYIVPCWEPTHGRLISCGSTDSVVHLWDIRATGPSPGGPTQGSTDRIKPSMTTRVASEPGKKVLCGAWLPNTMVSMVRVCDANECQPYGNVLSLVVTALISYPPPPSILS
jgi:WD40 repeat protein